MKLDSNHGFSNGRHCSWCFSQFCQKMQFTLLHVGRKNDPERIVGSIKTYLFNSSYHIEPTTKVTRHLKICVSFADKYITFLKTIKQEETSRY